MFFRLCLFVPYLFIYLFIIYLFIIIYLSFNYFTYTWDMLVYGYGMAEYGPKAIPE